MEKTESEKKKNRKRKKNEYNKRNNYILSPKIAKAGDKYFNSTELDPIIEGKDEFDEKRKFLRRTNQLYHGKL